MDYIVSKENNFGGNELIKIEKIKSNPFYFWKHP